MIDFRYQGLPWNIVFGAGSLAGLPGELDKLGFSRALVLCTPTRRDQGRMIGELLDARAVGLFDRAVMHVPLQTVGEAVARAQRLEADCSVAIGGGSTTGLGKALALKIALPNIVIPTSYAGSEMTNIWGMTENGRKVTGRNDAVLPTLAVYDPELTLTLPPKFSAASGLNAMAQAAVNVTTTEVSPMVSLMALEAVRVLARGLPRIIAEPGNLDARTEVLYGACLAGAALGAGTTSLHHRLCHTLGGMFATPHAETHAVLLPHSVAYNAAATAPETRRLAEAIGADDAALGIFELAKALGVAMSLKDIGVRESELDEAAAVATEKAFSNPEPVSRERVRALLENAYRGVRPQPV